MTDAACQDCGEQGQHLRPCGFTGCKMRLCDECRATHAPLHADDCEYCGENVNECACSEYQSERY